MLNLSIWNISQNSTIIVSIGISCTEQWIQIISGLFAAVFGGIGNFLMYLGIIRCQKLRTRFFIMLCFLLATRVTLLLLGAFPLGIYRLIRILKLIEIHMKAIICYTWNMIPIFGFTMEMVLILVMVLDRFLAIVKPMYYHTLTIGQAVWTCGIACTLVILLKIIPSLIGINFNSIVVCSNSVSATTDTFNFYHENLDMALWCLILSVYLSLIGYVKCHMIPKARRQNEGHPDLASYKRQYHLLIVLKRMIFIHCGLLLLAKILFSLSGFIPSQGPKFMVYSTYVGYVKSVLDVLTLLNTHKNLRAASFPCWYKKPIMSTVVVTMNNRSHCGRETKNRNINSKDTPMNIL